MSLNNDNNIPFSIRLRDDLRVTTEDGCDLALRARLHRADRTPFFRARLGARDAAVACDAWLALRAKAPWRTPAIWCSATSPVTGPRHRW